MKLIRTFICQLTGDPVHIYKMPDGTQVAKHPQIDELLPSKENIEALCIEYLLS